MDVSRLDQIEQLAVVGSVVALLAGLISNFGGLLYLALVAALVMIVVVLLPHVSPSTSLPGSRGTLMATLGLVAAACAVITAAQWFGVIGAVLSSLSTIMFLVALAATLVMAWAGWQQLQAEGGTWRFTMRPPGIGPSRPARAARDEAVALSAADEELPREAEA